MSAMSPADLFESRIREMAQTTPSMSLATAIVIADRDGTLIPFPDHARDDANAVALWAAQLPEVVNFIAQHRPIHAIKEIRSAAPSDAHGRSLSLATAKAAADKLSARAETP